MQQTLPRENCSDWLIKRFAGLEEILADAVA